MMKRVCVKLGHMNYDILIGQDGLKNAGALIAAELGVKKVGIISDENVAPRHLNTLMASLQHHHIKAIPLIVPAGEPSKSFATLEHVVNHFLEAKLERDDGLIALGGGVIGDLSGFASAIIRRGVKFIQMPTSLLSQVDSSVGGKTGINARYGKNLIGVFNQPNLVIADLGVLDSLPKREFLAGFAEVIKYGLINQPEFFAWLKQNWRDILDHSGPARAEAIRSCCQFKRDIVEKDEREKGERALLNLGHTFGHALETATHYDSARLNHGEGVAIGMTLAFQFSQSLGLCPANQAEEVEQFLAEVGLPTKIQHIPQWQQFAPQQLCDYIKQDKKVKAGALTFILAKAIGQAFVAHDVDPQKLYAFLQQKMANL